MSGSAAAHYSPGTPLTIVPGGELDALAGSLSEGGQRIAVLAQRLPLKTYETVTWINAGKRAENSARPVCEFAGARQGRVRAHPGAGGAR